MSQAISPGTGRTYGLARVARVWGRSRATIYRHRAAASGAASAIPMRRGPVGACSDAALLEHIRAEILGSRLHGEGYRKIWARLRHAGIRTSARRVRRLMGQHGLLAPHRVGRPDQRARRHHHHRRRGRNVMVWTPPDGICVPGWKCRTTTRGGVRGTGYHDRA